MAMVNSSRNVYNVMTNLKFMVRERKDMDLQNYCHGFDKCYEGMLEKCRRVYNDIENHYYGYDEFIIYALHSLMFKNSITLSGVITKNVRATLKLFSKKQLEIDKQFILDINKELQLRPDPLYEMFKLQPEHGESMIYRWTKQKILSPIFFMRYEKKVLTDRQEDAIFKHDDYKRFEFVSDQLIKYIKRSEVL